MVEEGEPDPEFESILDTVDPNRSDARQLLRVVGGWGSRLYIFSV
jgi:hypothetical protein